MATRLAIVTGTTSGIGQAVAHALLGHNWHVLGAARRPSGIEHDAYTHVRMDLHDLGALAETLDQQLTTLLREREWSRVGLVNNAADPGLLGPIAVLDARRLTDVFAANTAAPLWLMGALVRLTPPESSLRIVNVSTGAAVHPFPGLAAYGSSKAALRMAGMVLATELDSAGDAALRQRDIAILSYEPGAVDTPMQAWARTQSAAVLPSVELFVRFAAEQRLVSPDRPARDIVAFLESGAPSPRFLEQRLGA